jgi:protein involved in temperature-dependent protein secretion
MDAELVTGEVHRLHLEPRYLTQAKRLVQGHENDWPKPREATAIGQGASLFVVAQDSASAFTLARPLLLAEIAARVPSDVARV